MSETIKPRKAITINVSGPGANFYAGEYHGIDTFMDTDIDNKTTTALCCMIDQFDDGDVMLERSDTTINVLWGLKRFRTLKES